MNNHTKKIRGFSLIQTLVVVSIIGIITAVAVGVYRNVVRDVRADVSDRVVADALRMVITGDGSGQVPWASGMDMRLQSARILVNGVEIATGTNVLRSRAVGVIGSYYDPLEDYPKAFPEMGYRAVVFPERDYVWIQDNINAYNQWSSAQFSFTLGAKEFVKRAKEMTTLVRWDRAQRAFSISGRLAQYINTGTVAGNLDYCGDKIAVNDTWSGYAYSKFMRGYGQPVSASLQWGYFISNYNYIESGSPYYIEGYLPQARLSEMLSASASRVDYLNAVLRSGGGFIPKKPLGELYAYDYADSGYAYTELYQNARDGTQMYYAYFEGASDAYNRYGYYSLYIYQ